MDRVNGWGWIDIGGGRRGFIDEDPPTGVEGTEVPALWLNMLQEEMFKVIEEAGLAPSAVDWTQLWQAIMTLASRAAINRPRGFTAVKSFTTTAPPGAPAQFDIYLVPAGATGAWAGQTNKFAEYTGTAWRFTAPEGGTLVQTADTQLWLEWTGTAWGFAYASTAQYGFTRLATLLESLGTSSEIALTPAGLREAVKFRQLAETKNATAADFTIGTTVSTNCHSLGVAIPDAANRVVIETENAIQFTNNGVVQNGIGGSIFLLYLESGGVLTPARQIFVEVASSTNSDQRYALVAPLSFDFNLTPGVGRTLSVFVNIACADFESMTRKTGSIIRIKFFSAT